MTIYTEIQQERAYQTQRWGTDNDKLNTPFHWASYISQYATRNLIGNPAAFPDEDAFRVDMIKVAALAVAAVESLDSKE